jgi:two-component system response regulator HydG
LKADSETKIPLPEKESEDERIALLNALDRTGWNKAKAARLVGISRRTIYRKMETHKLKEPTF